MNKEHIYDSQIAPLMTQIIAICKASGIALHADFELDIPEDSAYPMHCLTHLLGNAGISARMRMQDAAARCGGNVDKFIWWLKKDAAEHGHSSIELSLMGVPLTPNPEAQRR